MYYAKTIDMDFKFDETSMDESDYSLIMHIKYSESPNNDDQGGYH